MGLFDGTALERPVICERCNLNIKECVCPPVKEDDSQPEVPPEKQSVKVRVEKRKRGKLMTVIAGFSAPRHQLQALLTELKNFCGSGGTIVDQSLELQGDHVERLKPHLRSLGYRVQ